VVHGSISQIENRDRELRIANCELRIATVIVSDSATGVNALGGGLTAVRRFAMMRAM
jgi:hypothetical protein